MDLYRRPDRVPVRMLGITAALTLVVGGLAGYAAGRATEKQPTLEQRLADLRRELGPARQGIELAATEYAQAVRGGRLVAPSEYAAARQDVRRATDAVAGARDELRALGAARAAAVDRSLASLATAVERRADPEQVDKLSAAANAALAAAVDRA